MKKSIWRNGQCCIKCKQELSNREVMYSGGRCPKCGHKGSGAGTIVDVEEFSYRYVVWWDLSFPFRHKFKEFVWSSV